MTDYDADAGWHPHARCVIEGKDPRFFFPPRGGNDEVRGVKAYCQPCPVRQECLEYALNHCIKHGVWGGTSERDRRTLRAQRNQRLRLTSIT